MRFGLILWVVLLCSTVATGQQDRRLNSTVGAPPELPGFTMRLNKDSNREWWYRHHKGWDFFARPTDDVWANPPLAVVSPEQVVAKNFGLNLKAWSQDLNSPGFTSGGGGSFKSAPSPADDAPIESDDPIEQLLRRNRIPVGAFYAGAGSIGSALVFLLLLLLRRLLLR